MTKAERATKMADAMDDMDHKYAAAFKALTDMRSQELSEMFLKIDKEFSRSQTLEKISKEVHEKYGKDFRELAKGVDEPESFADELENLDGC